MHTIKVKTTDDIHDVLMAIAGADTSVESGSGDMREITLRFPLECSAEEAAEKLAFLDYKVERGE